MYDLIIKNGNIIDGTASPVYHADIAVSGGKIAKISENITDDAKKIIDASGLTVTPGFIDSHSHSDNAMFEFPDMIEKIEQGITTAVGGQCGSTIAPISREINEKNATMMEGFGMSNEVLKTFGTMADAVKDVPFGSNIISFVGHKGLRTAVMGEENRKPTDEEMKKMKELLKEAMENGAVGVSFGLNYVPSCYAETDELIELAKTTKEHNGLISAHIRDEGKHLYKAVDEFLRIVKAANVKAVLSHHKSMYIENWGKVHHTLRMIDEACAEGYDVYCDCYPYNASHTGILPTIVDQEIRKMYPGRLIDSLSDPGLRRLIKETYIKNNSNTLSNLAISHCAKHPEYEGLRLDEVARLRGQDEFEAAFDIIIECRGTIGICNFCMCEEDIETVLKYPRTMICTDSSVARNNRVYHPRLRASFPRFLGRYIRDRKILSLEEAIRKCTAMPSAVYGLKNKGLLKAGMDADICIFDAKKIIDKAEFTNCSQRCEGLNYVILGGEIVVENAIYNGKKKGSFIKRDR